LLPNLQFQSLEAARNLGSAQEFPSLHFFPKLSSIGQRFIPGWPIIKVELQNLLDGSN